MVQLPKSWAPHKNLYKTHARKKLSPIGLQRGTSFADRYERASLLITSNLPFSEWSQVFQGERMTAALLDRQTHHCHIFEMNGQSYRFRESVKTRTGKKDKTK